MARAIDGYVDFFALKTSVFEEFGLCGRKGVGSVSSQDRIWGEG